MTKLPPTHLTRLMECHAHLLEAGQLITPDEIQVSLGNFRRRFGPDQLRGLQGRELLMRLYAPGTKDSLAYWLEFKNDDDFQGMKFGSIAGGSAHKTGLFLHSKTQQWTTGSPLSPKVFTESEAMALSAAYRDEMLAGCERIARLPAEAGAEDYASLQSDIERLCPQLYQLSFLHKFFLLNFPDKLDDYHGVAWRRHHLICLLVEPPETFGLYARADVFVSLARQLGWPMAQLTQVLNTVNGRLMKYWRVGTSTDEKKWWPDMRSGGFVAVGWDEVGDLSDLGDAKPASGVVWERLKAHFPQMNEAVRTKKSKEIANLAHGAEEGDLVLAADGQTILGIGRITGGYFYVNEPMGHRRPVEWLHTEPFQMPFAKDGILTSFKELQKHAVNLVDIRRRLLEPVLLPQTDTGKRIDPAPTRRVVDPARTLDLVLEGIPGRVQAVLQRKGQVILHGPPGTGKTFWAVRAARELAALSHHGRSFAELSAQERDDLTLGRHPANPIRFCTFHPAYGYEDFLEGYRPRADGAGGGLGFSLRDGIFKQLCLDAHQSPDRLFFLIIDEINRGDIPRIFGELLTLLEMDKRGMSALLPLSGEAFQVPPNVRVIGTMNTADRSIALLDTALRRRFGFVELMPDTAPLAGCLLAGRLPLAGWVEALNGRVRSEVGRDARNLQVGQAYFLESGKPVSDFARFCRVLQEDVFPLLEEYCYENYPALERILGSSLVDVKHQRVRAELLDPLRKDEVVTALLMTCPELGTAPEVLAPGETDEPESEDDDESGP